jgi:hypothetical protein
LEEDLGDAGGLLQGGEVASVAKGDRSGASQGAEVGFTLWWARPVVIAVDQGHGHGNAVVECSGGGHALDVAEDLACHARVPATAADSTQLVEVVIMKLALVD